MTRLTQSGKEIFRSTPLLLIALTWGMVARPRELCAPLELFSTTALPPLSEVIVAWIDMIKSGELINNGIASLYRGAAGPARSIAIGATPGTVSAWGERGNL